jgi:hypothetical protein
MYKLKKAMITKKVQKKMSPRLFLQKIRLKILKERPKDPQILNFKLQL